MDTIHEIIQKSLWRDYDDELEFPSQTPLLSHYTSLQNFDCIIDGQELWFSNPLNMNDSDELIFGMNQGTVEFRRNAALIKACGTEEVFVCLLRILDYHFNHFDKNHVLDTYISCFSRHDEDDYDGSLSMWRGYGSNGGGVSFVIDTKKIPPNQDSPIILAPVHYATNEERIEWTKSQINRLAGALSSLEKSDKVLNAIAWHWINRLKVFSLFTKNKGFKEEKEWRFVYLSDRDSESHYPSMFGYTISNKGVEPRLKLLLDQIPNTNSFPSLETLIDRVILGPTASSALSMRSLSRMLELKGKPALAKKVHLSSLPYRP